MRGSRRGRKGEGKERRIQQQQQKNEKKAEWGSYPAGYLPGSRHPGRRSVD